MLFGCALLLCALSVPLAGGRLRALADLRLEAAWALVVGLGLQILIVSVVPGGSTWLHEAVHLGSYAFVAWFVWVNRRIPFGWLIALGGALNLTAIAANGGVMPASAHAIERSGLELDDGKFTNSAPVDGAHLQWLGDVLWIPREWSLPTHNVFSVGDVLVVLGVALLLHAVCGSRLGRALTGARATTA